MCENEKLNTITMIARSLYDTSFDHGLPHVERVLKWSLEIAQREGLVLNKTHLLATVYLHDVGRYIGEPHAYFSALIAEELLKEAGCPEELIKEIVHAVKSHSYSFSRKELPSTPLARVLSDADKLDALGLVGFMRVFLYGDRRGRSIEQSIEHFHDKILKLSHLMNYDFSKRTSLVLTKRVEKLLEILNAELRLEVDEP